MIVAVFLALPRWYFLSPVILVGLFPLVTLPRPLPAPFAVVPAVHCDGVAVIARLDPFPSRLSLGRIEAALSRVERAGEP